MTTDHDTHLKIGYEDDTKQRHERDPDLWREDQEERRRELWPEQTEWERRTSKL